MAISETISDHAVVTASPESVAHTIPAVAGSEDERLQILQFLADLTGQLRPMARPDEVIAVVDTAVGEFLGVDCGFTEIDEEKDRFNLRHIYRRDGRDVTGTYPLSDFGTGQFDDLRAGQVVTIDDAAKDPRTSHAYATAHAPLGVASFACIPLIKEGRWIACLNVSFDRPRTWQPNETWLLQKVLEHVWFALENARLYALAQEEIEERRRAEAEVRISAERYRSLAVATSSLVFNTDANGLFVTPQTSWEAYTGQNWEQQQNNGGFLMVHPEDRDRSYAVWERSVTTRTTFEIEQRIWHQASQQHRWCVVRAVPVLNADGTVREWVGVATDIHEQKVRQAHQELLEQLNESILSLSNPDDILWAAVNKVGPFLRLNRCHFGDLDRENDRFTLHRSYLYEATSTVGEHNATAFGPAFVQALRDGQTIVVHDTMTDPLVSSFYRSAYEPLGVGAFIAVPCMSAGRCAAVLIGDSKTPRTWLLEEAQLLETIAYRIWLAVENSRLYQQAQAELQERRAVQEALRRSEERYRRERERLSAIIAEMPAGVMLISVTGELLLANREADRIYSLPDLMALTHEEFQQWSVYSLDGTLVPRDNYPIVRALTTGETVRDEEYLLERRDGTRVPLLVNAAPFHDENGGIAAAILTFTDRTIAKQIEAALEQSEERSRSLVEVLAALVWTSDGVGKFVTPQVAWERYTGQPWEHHQGYGWSLMLHPEDRDRLVAPWHQAANMSVPYRVEGRLWHSASQRYRHFVARAVPLYAADGTIREWVGSVEDVDDAKNREAQILALNARLRLGIQETHHRVKNNLQIIGAMLDMSLMDAEHALPLSDARRIASQIQMLAKVHDILTAEAKFDRFGEDISSQSVLGRLLALLEAASGIHVEGEIEEVALSVPQATALALVVNELASNAAKHGNGTVQIVFTVGEGKAILCVRDDGPGFHPEFDIRNSASTGLLIVEQVVRHDLGGTLKFANRRDRRGAEVCITIPLRKKQTE